MRIRLLLVPYSLGQDENRGAGASPLRYVQAGIGQVFSESGLTVTVERIQQEVEHALGTIVKHFPIKAAALTAYNPERDLEEKTLQIGLRLLTLLAESARSHPGK